MTALSSFHCSGSGSTPTIQRYQWNKQIVDILLGKTSAKIRYFTWQSVSKDSIFYLAKLRQRFDILLGGTSMSLSKLRTFYP
jgi:hypothetical protein